MISPRLFKLLELLLDRKEPVPVDAIAKNLGISRRTVFRELENVDELITRYRLELSSVPGRGIRLICGDEDRQKLAAALREEHSLKPGNRQERLLCLLLELLSNDGILQKLFYYADFLGVSEATVSSDLDALEPVLGEYGLTLIRKPGQGVYVLGGEADIRSAMTAALLREKPDIGSYAHAYGYPPRETEHAVRELCGRLKPHLDWMTEASLEMLGVFLMVTVERIQKGRSGETGIQDVPQSGGDTGSGTAFQVQLAETLTEGIRRRFALELGPEEKNSLVLRIQSCRAKLHTPLSAGDAAEELNALTFKMIDAFDPSLAPILKTDEQLTEGLSRHLLPAITRIEHHVKLPDPFQGQLDSQYPDLFENCGRAIAVLENHLGRPVPEGEVAFVAIHFYAALLKIGEKNIRKRTLRAGIVCVAGIGSSYMMLSQIRKRFRGELDLEVCAWNDNAAWDSLDFLISTISLEIQKPVVHVHTLLTPEDYRKIREAINSYAFEEKTAALGEKRFSLPERIGTAVALLEKTRTLLSRFGVYPVNPSIPFEEMVRFAADTFGRGTEGADRIFRDLMAREALYTQVIEELGIVLLHSRSAGAGEPVFALIIPKTGGGNGGRFLDPYFRGAAATVLMLLPQDGPPEITQIMGALSGALVDTPVFLDAVRRGNGPLTRNIMEAELSDVLARYCGEKLKG
ncbi:MAG: transcription antiterminator [Spirochaetaceae bacterium]|nr:transcription antiterminator [Spirochaetaceae bacterium]